MMNKRWLMLIITSLLYADERMFIDTMSRYVSISQTVKNKLYTMASSSPVTHMKNSQVNRPLYRAYPQLQETLPHIVLGDLPTPIIHLSNIEDSIDNRCQLFLKDDGLTGMMGEEGRSFGGNKIRKLEFLMADALIHNASSVMTFGCIGSNHVVATAVCAQQVGLRCVALLAPQEITDVVKRNMLLMREYNVEMILNPNREIRGMQTVCSFVQSKYNYGDMPYFIPTGGSCPMGIIGFVNAAFELKEQIEAGLLPEPDYIYVATGSCGTLTGLMLGVRVAGLKTKVIGVAVEPDEEVNPFVMNTTKLLRETSELLHGKDASFPLFEWHEEDVQVLLDFGGPNYGVVTPEALAAIDVMKEKENVQLDTTYTGKACAGFLHDISNGYLDGKTVLFWNTFCAQVQQSTVNPENLAPAFRNFLS
jgi:D-cysteine desulfhydrase